MLRPWQLPLQLVKTLTTDHSITASIWTHHEQLNTIQQYMGDCASSTCSDIHDSLLSRFLLNIVLGTNTLSLILSTCVMSFPSDSDSKRSLRRSSVLSWSGSWLGFRMMFSKLYPITPITKAHGHRMVGAYVLRTPAITGHIVQYGLDLRNEIGFNSIIIVKHNKKYIWQKFVVLQYRKFGEPIW